MVVMPDPAEGGRAAGCHARSSLALRPRRAHSSETPQLRMAVMPEPAKGGGAAGCHARSSPAPTVFRERNLQLGMAVMPDPAYEGGAAGCHARSSPAPCPLTHLARSPQ